MHVSDEKRAKLLFGPERIAAEVDRLAADINRDFQGRSVVLVGCLTGAFVFMADLMRRLDIDVECDFIKVSSYEDRMTPGSIVLERDLARSVEGRDIIVVEDIVDTGRTLAYIRDHLHARRPASVSLCALIYKESPRATLPKDDIRYLGMTVPDVFIVGYGIDWAQKYRALPYVGCIEPA